MKTYRHRPFSQIRRPIRLHLGSRAKAKGKGRKTVPITWVDSLAKSFSHKTPLDWVPSQYKPLMDHYGPKKRTIH